MKTSDFDFVLPEALIAETPAEPRDSSRLLVVGESISDARFSDILGFLKAGDVMVFNDTKVIPARLYATLSSPLEGEGRVGGKKVEILLHKKYVSHHCPPPHPNPPPQGGKGYIMWQCFAKPAKKLRVGNEVVFAADFSAKVIEKCDDGQVVLQFSTAGFSEKLERYGAMPLPPYIEKKRHADKSDNTRYQTVYAAHEGSVAAPTAGLHFTPELLAKIVALGVKCVHVTLHVGGGTFLPVKTEDTNDHVMHSEYAEVSAETMATINAAKAAGGRVICVGTTSLRTLESAAGKAFSGETSIFITPGYRFNMVDMLLTNFHLPKSTLFMLVSAFCGLERMKKAYAHAISQKYRFYSYGDACLLFRHEP